ncbi:uncharacterized protein LOC131951236 [Physella acuta]|uniref:uncharacterized protein LOC131951236 n=1 Tax=Physella acuta TaxID=109671 RepID=UPI0027DBB5DB|nr:uncharacterized protein LOC131951236 [Physella acuta]
MANASLTSSTNAALVLFSLLLMVVLVHAQGLSRYEEHCGGCWLEMDDLVNTLRSDSYNHRGEDRPEESGETLQLLSSRLQRQLFRRSEPTSLECEVCWIVLNRLKTAIKKDSEKEVTNFGQLVKKAMLNNGWM